MATEFTAKHSYELRSVHTWTDLLIGNIDTSDWVVVNRIMTVYNIRIYPSMDNIGRETDRQTER